MEMGNGVDGSETGGIETELGRGDGVGIGFLNVAGVVEMSSRGWAAVRPNAGQIASAGSQATSFW